MCLDAEEASCCCCFLPTLVEIVGHWNCWCLWECWPVAGLDCKLLTTTRHSSSILTPSASLCRRNPERLNSVNKSLINIIQILLTGKAEYLHDPMQPSAVIYTKLNYDLLILPTLPIRNAESRFPNFTPMSDRSLSNQSQHKSRSGLIFNGFCTKSYTPVEASTS